MFFFSTPPCVWVSNQNKTWTETTQGILHPFVTIFASWWAFVNKLAHKHTNIHHCNLEEKICTHWSKVQWMWKSPREKKWLICIASRSMKIGYLMRPEQISLIQSCDSRLAAATLLIFFFLSLQTHRRKLCPLLVLTQSTSVLCAQGLQLYK